MMVPAKASNQATTAGQASLARGPADAALLERLHSSEEAALEILVRHQGAKLLAVARRFLDTEEHARETVQEAFQSAFQALPRFRGESSLSIWLHRILISTVLRKLRSARAHGEPPIEALLPRFDGRGHHLAPVEPWPASSTSLEALAGNGETRRTIRACVASLPLSHRVVLILHDVEGYSTAEAARILALTPSVVRTRLHQARLALRALLAPCLRATPETLRAAPRP